MYKALFSNSKAALLFAGFTVVSAVMLIGSPEEKGVVNKAVDMVGQPSEPITEGPTGFSAKQTDTGTKEQPKSVWSKSSWKQSGWDENPTSSPDNSKSVAFPTADPAAPATSASGPPKARIPGPQPVEADLVGIPVPGDDGD